MLDLKRPRSVEGALGDEEAFSWETEQPAQFKNNNNNLLLNFLIILFEC